jgi:hypothetical protein
MNYRIHDTIGAIMVIAMLISFVPTFANAEEQPYRLQVSTPSMSIETNSSTLIELKVAIQDVLSEFPVFEIFDSGYNNATAGLNDTQKQKLSDVFSDVPASDLAKRPEIQPSLQKLNTTIYEIVNALYTTDSNITDTQEQKLIDAVNEFFGVAFRQPEVIERLK